MNIILEAKTSNHWWVDGRDSTSRISARIYSEKWHSKQVLGLGRTVLCTIHWWWFEGTEWLDWLNLIDSNPSSNYSNLYFIIQTLEELINGHNDDDEFLKIPPLGRHYSLRWAEDDLMQEQREGSRIGEKKKVTATTAVANEEAHRLMNSVTKSK